MASLRTSLHSYHMDIVRQIAEHIGVTLPKSQVRKALLVRAVAEKIQEHAGSETYIQSLPAAERGALGVILQKGSPLQQHDIVMPLLLARLLPVTGSHPDALASAGQSVLRSLLRKGLIVNLTPPRSGTKRTLDAVITVEMPPEVAIRLPRALLPFPEPQEKTRVADAPPIIETGDVERFIRRLFLFWAELLQAPAKQLKAGGMYKRDIRRVGESLGLDIKQHEEDLRWLYSFLKIMNLVKIKNREIYAREDGAVMRFWDASSVQQVDEMLRAYRRWPEPLEVQEQKLYSYTYYSRGPSYRPEHELRAEVVQLLPKLAQTTWTPLSLLMAFLNGGTPGRFLYSDTSLQGLERNLRWYYSKRSDDFLTVIGELERDVAIQILEEMQRFGFISLGYEKGESEGQGEKAARSLSALQVTPITRALHQDKAVPQEEGVWQIVLQPDFQILAMGPAPLSVLAQLELMAEREKVGKGVIEYRLTRESVYQAFQRDFTENRLREFLDEITEQPLPQNVARSLEEWGAQHERIVLRRDICILQVDEAEILEMLLKDEKIHLYLNRLDERTAWTPSAKAAKVRERLWELEYLPTVSHGPEKDLPRSLQWDDNVLRPRHPLPSLYVTGTMRRIADEVDGHWELTSDSVETAAAMGMDVPDIIALLERMTGESMSADWEKRLKAWGKHFGAGEYAHLLLLRMDSAKALEELRSADRRLHRWLRPLVKESGLAVVNEKHWDEVQERLAEWGVDIKENRWW
ncbi:MAG: helicase-associated domain-containing protein [Anaerolineales bacterium]